MNYSAFIPRLFDARFHGVYTLATVLEYHKSIENYMPQDGIVWAVEHPKEDILIKRSQGLTNRIAELDNAQTGQPYAIWTILDKEAHILRCRLQLIECALNNCPVS